MVKTISTQAFHGNSSFLVRLSHIVSNGDWIQVKTRRFVTDIFKQGNAFTPHIYLSFFFLINTFLNFSLYTSCLRVCKLNRKKCGPNNFVKWITLLKGVFYAKFIKDHRFTKLTHGGIGGIKMPVIKWIGFIFSHHHLRLKVKYLKKKQPQSCQLIIVNCNSSSDVAITLQSLKISAITSSVNTNDSWLLKVSLLILNGNKTPLKSGHYMSP